MRNIMVVECRSTGTNYIEDIINRGYNPVVLEPKYGESEKGDEYLEGVHNEYKDIKYDFDLIYEQDSYEETLELVRKFDPLLILPGNEKGVILASRLAYDLNLKCNDIKNLDAMTFKDEMQKRIAEAGLRSIRGKSVRTIEEAIEFYDAEALEEVVIKPKYSAGSASVRICSNKEEMIASLEELFEKTNAFGEENIDLLIQERINGDEYIVNTVSCGGRHRVTLVWKYNKVKTKEGAIIYDTCETVNELDLGEAEMVEYAYDVADAIGIEWGPIHGEYMIDEKGPVLIEVNCRPCGGHMPARFLDKISGQHETDSILDSYLKPERFNEKAKQKYNLLGYGALKFFIVPQETTAIATPIRKICFNLKSFFQITLDKLSEEDKRTYFKTEDVDSSCGIVFLAYQDENTVQRDIHYLRSVEKNAFSLILTEEKKNNEISEELDLSFIDQMVKEADKYGTGLFITDQFIENDDVVQISPDKIDSIGGEFDFVIINLNKSIVEDDVTELVKSLLFIFGKVKNGGTVIIPKTTYRLFTNERRGMEAIVKALNFKIELPPYGVKDMIVATKMS